MSNPDIRFHYLDQIYRNFLQTVQNSLNSPTSPETFSKEYLFYNSDKVQLAVNEYYKNLDYWKKFFNIKDKIDRHKVSALTMHYLLKYQPIEQKGKSNKIAIAILINEFICLNIGLALLKNGNKPFDHISVILRSSIIRSLNFHMKKLESHEKYNECIPDFVSLLAIIMYQIERDHINQ